MKMSPKHVQAMLAVCAVVPLLTGSPTEGQEKEVRPGVAATHTLTTRGILLEKEGVSAKGTVLTAYPTSAMAVETEKPATQSSAIITGIDGTQTVVTDLRAEYESEAFAQQGIERTPSHRYGLQTIEIEFEVREGLLRAKENLSLSFSDLRRISFDRWLAGSLCRPVVARFEKRDGSLAMLSPEPLKPGRMQYDMRYEEKDAEGKVTRSLVGDFNLVDGVNHLVGFKGTGRLASGAKADFSVGCPRVRTIEFR